MKCTLSLLCFVVLTSCSPSPSLWLITDTYFLEVQPEFQKEFAVAAGANGYKAEVVVHKPFQGVSEFLEPLKEGFNEERDTLVFSPLLTADFYLEFRNSFPTISTILFEAPLDWADEKTFVVGFERYQAFQESAVAAAEWLESLGEDSLAGAFFYGRFEHRTWEKEKFMESWASRSSLERLIQIDVFLSADFDPLQRQLENMLKASVRLVVSLASAQNGYILGQLAKENVALITEDWEKTQYLTEKVLGSVEKDWGRALKMALENRGKGEAHSLIFPAEFRKNKNFTFKLQENATP